jgi:hypothetical protein
LGGKNIASITLKIPRTTLLRIRIIQKPGQKSIDGIQLSRFQPGCQYEVGNVLGALLLSEGWAEPVADEQPVRLVPLEKSNSDERTGDEPPNLIRERRPDYVEPSTAPDLNRRKRRS